MYDLFCGIFNYLPLAHVINRKVLVMHGGLPTDPKCRVDDLRDIQRFRQPPDEGAFCELLWNDPAETTLPIGIDRKASKRGIGFEFGQTVTDRFCRNNNLEYIIRSHEMKSEGYEVSHNGRVVTIFSAPNYCDQMGNRGAFITVYGSDALLKPEFTQFAAVAHPKTKSYMSSMFSMLGA